MKKPFIYLAALFLTAGLAVAQDTGGDKATGTGTTHTGKKQPPDSAAKTTSGKKGHKGGKKGNKGGKTVTDEKQKPGNPPPTRPSEQK